MANFGQYLADMPMQMPAPPSGNNNPPPPPTGQQPPNPFSNVGRNLNILYGGSDEEANRLIEAMVAQGVPPPQFQSLADFENIGRQFTQQLSQGKSTNQQMQNSPGGSAPFMPENPGLTLGMLLAGRRV